MKQECIPVGCVPTAAVAAIRCQNWEGGLLGGGVPTSMGEGPCLSTSIGCTYLSGGGLPYPPSGWNIHTHTPWEGGCLLRGCLPGRGCLPPPFRGQKE